MLMCTHSVKSHFNQKKKTFVQHAHQLPGGVGTGVGAGVGPEKQQQRQ